MDNEEFSDWAEEADAEGFSPSTCRPKEKLLEVRPYVEDDNENEAAEVFPNEGDR